MKKIKISYYWYFVILLILIMLAFGYFFGLGEELGKSLAVTH